VGVGWANSSEWKVDLVGWYSEAMSAVELVNRRGFRVWADVGLDAVTNLGIAALIMNHVPVYICVCVRTNICVHILVSRTWVLLRLL